MCGNIWITFYIASLVGILDSCSSNVDSYFLHYHEQLPRIKWVPFVRYGFWKSLVITPVQKDSFVFSCSAMLDFGLLSKFMIPLYKLLLKGIGKKWPSFHFNVNLNLLPFQNLHFHLERMMGRYMYLAQFYSFPLSFRKQEM